MANPAGEAESGALRLDFDRRLMLQFAVPLSPPMLDCWPIANLMKLERSALRPGNVHSADGWDGMLKPVVARYQGKVSRIYFPGGRGLCNARGLRVLGSRADQVCHPATGQPNPAA